MSTDGVTAAPCEALRAAVLADPLVSQVSALPTDDSVAPAPSSRLSEEDDAVDASASSLREVDGLCGKARDGSSAGLTLMAFSV